MTTKKVKRTIQASKRQRKSKSSQRLLNKVKKAQSKRRKG